MNSPSSKLLKSVRAGPFAYFHLSDKYEKGSTAIYSLTAFSELFLAGGPEYAMKVEFEQGKNIANAAAKTSTLKHFIWSTLPSTAKISKGKYLVPHFEAKSKVDEHIKSNAVLYAKTTFLWLTYFAQNYSSPMFTPNFVVSDMLLGNS
jgi:hypothetical protein